MKILIIIGIVLVVIIGVSLIAGLMMPSEKLVSRSRLIDAPDSVLYNQVVKLDNWPNWSAWHRLDSNMKIEYSPNVSGVGAWYTWSGNDKVKNGRMTIISTVPNQMIVDKMEFGNFPPAEGLFKFSPKDGKTLMTMELNVKSSTIPFTPDIHDIRKSIASDYDKCLANMDEFISKKNQQKLLKSK
jgi:hypothetical protein